MNLHLRFALVTTCALAFCGMLHAQPVLVGVTAAVSGVGLQPANRLVDVDMSTGTVSNSRSLGIKVMCGIATQPSTGTLFGLTSDFSNPVSSLIRIDPTTGGVTVIGATGLPMLVEGDLAFNPLNGLLYGIGDGGVNGTQRNFFSINSMTGAATVIGNLGSTGDYSALAFDNTGVLWTVDSDGLQNSRLIAINPLNAQVINTKMMNVNLGGAVGLTFQPGTGVAYLADDATGPASGGTNSLYTLDASTGIATLIGPTGDPHGLAGLAIIGVPEPSSLMLGALVISTAFVKRRAVCSRHRNAG